MSVRLETRQSELKSTLLTPPSESERGVFAGFLNLWNLRNLIGLMVERDFIGRYKGSLLGLLWPLLNPIGHMLLYTFLFNVILKVKFGDSIATSNFALCLMCGFLPWTAMSEAVASSTTKILEMPNLVKRIVFPLEILPLVTAISAFFSGAIAIMLLCVVVGAIQLTLHPTILLVPVVVLSQFMFTLGLCWIMASLGVFIRDSKHIIALALSAWMYATPIVYPASMVPDHLKWILTINPVAGMIIDYRKLILAGELLNPLHYATYTTVSVITLAFGFFFFYKTKKSFADII